MGVERSTYSVRNTTLNFSEEMERLKLQASMGWQKELRNLKWYGLQNKQNVLEVGSGPGFVTRQLLCSLPDVRITALEIDDRTLHDFSQEQLQDISADRIQFVHSTT
ncbi:rRNA adenine N-6-methyltransferase family protein [Paenibacillus lemnae]|uniref:rRNA adenine N-6-methyltransferase n=1 Tax=Paenibacillus lemnae TaxID=1330551 RepID=A0A848M7N8_PAELE|nr:rRNA adenine N-6-methyltransferase family protein [Paenibacillus lemnae]NMO97017.1 hypothetical protein [Paenibacillus lemnae]